MCETACSTNIFLGIIALDLRTRYVGFQSLLNLSWVFLFVRLTALAGHAASGEAHLDISPVVPSGARPRDVEVIALQFQRHCASCVIIRPVALGTLFFCHFFLFRFFFQWDCLKLCQSLRHCKYIYEFILELSEYEAFLRLLRK